MRSSAIRLIALFMFLGVQTAYADYAVTYGSPSQAGRVYNAGTNSTTFTYTVYGSGDPNIVSPLKYFMLEDCGALLPLLSYSPEYPSWSWGPPSWPAQNPTVYSAPDPIFSLIGLQWFGWHDSGTPPILVDVGQSREFTMTFPGNVPQGTTRYGSRYRNYVTNMWVDVVANIEGPNCQPGSSPSPSPSSSLSPSPSSTPSASPSSIPSVSPSPNFSPSPSASPPGETSPSPSSSPAASGSPSPNPSPKVSPSLASSPPPAQSPLPSVVPTVEASPNPPEVDCNDIDISEAQFTLDGNTNKLLNLVRKAAKFVKRTAKHSQDKSFAAEAIANGTLLHQESWTLIWSVPSILTTCSELGETCVSSSNAEPLEGFISGSNNLRILVNRLVDRALKHGGPRSKLLKLKRLARKLHKVNKKLEDSIPEESVSCLETQ